MEGQKFKVGDKVYILKGNRIVEAIIEHINIEITSNNTKYNYYVEQLGYVNLLFESVEEVCTFLKSNIKDYKWIQGMD